ncbi:tRNA (guanosine(46)-N7)-methyltransferase TrmB [Ignatzschineria sp. F8392]|uniref:tRNA (guanosine(46)-N7)-methyltransferase TrmB n=1 Tax=Ignatzschineria sp. F8392 TaxID=1980117 RepID=UPI000B99061D|nr:tRNA (guanosine(46)-N7)-methyltransferase TrmB [Ignatzschineria sp. F8392]OYQ81726.1 tRNA (guanosine(46)-N7)-methyltransferase TrmB [Ignatzschineria sp. F8392]
MRNIENSNEVVLEKHDDVVKDQQKDRPLRTVRSFVKREGRLTKGQERILAESPYLLSHTIVDEVWDLDQIFGRQNRARTLEIGFGDGASLSKMAENAPERDFLGIEVHRPGVGRLLLDVEEKNLSNIRVIDYDAVHILKHAIPDGALDCVQIFFPDPWHKKKHHKRRIIQPEFVALIAKKLCTGGRLCLATDWEPYAEHMMEVMLAAPDYENSVEGFIENPTHRMPTKFEARGRRLGHGVWDLVFLKR